ncbi:MAG TPA: heme o synthase [Acidimicrobiia bacterium]|nr:heme o synthase [Acidimicrobiia bacterium]
MTIDREQSTESKMTKPSLLSELVALSKPRVIELLITTALPAMFLAAGDFPDAIKIFGVLIGGTLAAGSSNAINSILEKETDTNMNRTKMRPMAQGRLSQKFAWTFAILSQIIAFTIVLLTSNILAASFTLLASFVYVVVYTIWLKPRSDQNIVIGGAAGALPVIIGYTAVSENVSWQPIVMFLVVFFWTPAHFWALAVFHQEDYKKGGFPMMPITRGRKYTSKAMLVYALLTCLTSFGLVIDKNLGLIYLVTAAILAFWFIFEAIRLTRNSESIHRGRYMRFFHISNGYLAILFIAIAIDSVV